MDYVMMDVISDLFILLIIIDLVDYILLFIFIIIYHYCY